MESRSSSTWIQFNGGNGWTVSLWSHAFYGHRSPLIYGKKTDASEGGSGGQRWLDGFLWVMRRPSISLNCCHSPGSRLRWLSAVARSERRWQLILPESRREEGDPKNHRLIFAFQQKKRRSLRQVKENLKRLGRVAQPDHSPPFSGSQTQEMGLTLATVCLTVSKLVFL